MDREGVGLRIQARGLDADASAGCVPLRSCPMSAAYLAFALGTLWSATRTATR
jgi:hypothetical protein